MSMRQVALVLLGATLLAPLVRAQGTPAAADWIADAISLGKQNDPKDVYEAYLICTFTCGGGDWAVHLDTAFSKAALMVASRKRDLKPLPSRGELAALSTGMIDVTVLIPAPSPGRTSPAAERIVILKGGSEDSIVEPTKATPNVSTYTNGFGAVIKTQGLTATFPRSSFAAGNEIAVVFDRGQRRVKIAEEDVTNYR